MVRLQKVGFELFCVSSFGWRAESDVIFVRSFLFPPHSERGVQRYNEMDIDM